MSIQRSIGVGGRGVAIALALACAALGPAPASSSRQPAVDRPDRDAQRSPFTGVAFRGDRARVLIEDRWYELDAIGGDGWRLSWGELRAASERAFGEGWTGRIAMDLDAVLGSVGVRAGDTVTVHGRPLDGRDGAIAGAPVELTAVPHTHDKRRAATSMFREAEQRGTGAALRAPVPARPALGEMIAVLRDRHAQGMRRGVDWDGALATELVRLGERAAGAEIVRAAQRLVALSGDGHAGVAEFDMALPPGFLPFAFVWVDGEWRGFITKGASWVWPAGAADVRIDGVPVAEWIDAARPYVAAGAEHLVRHRCARLAQRAVFIRELKGVKKGPGDEVEVTWTLRADGEAPGGPPGAYRAPLEASGSRAKVRGSIPAGAEGVGFAWREIPGGGRVGCVRIESMGDGEAFGAALRGAIETALAGDAMLIDVRGNGGGARDALLVTLPYLMERDVLVFNLARPRLAIFDADRPPDDELLTDRFLRPVTWSRWSPAEREAIAAALRDARPSWLPAEGWEAAGFGPWYAGVVSRERHGARDVTGRARTPFAGPVAVLLDGGCFSATDIFLGAIEQLPNVMLVGTPSGGGSARKVPVRVEGPPRLSLQLASIASFRPDGRAYDGAGIDPDVEIGPAPEDFEGKGDRVLERALRVLGERLPPRR
ncbi:MAG: S41 family peptidase [Phycisphaerales bacterium]